jgi:predicted glycogen debranching enzyme
MPPERASTPPFAVYSLHADAGLERLAGSEWVLANGMGGFAMGTASGIPSRRYHGVLVSETPESPMRRVYVNTISEELVLTDSAGTRVVGLSSFRFRAGDGSDVLHPEGWKLLAAFEKGAGCRWEFEGPGVKVVKRLCVRRDARAAVVSYEVTPGKGVKAELRVRPLMSLRNFHWTQRRDEGTKQFEVTRSGSGCEVRRVGEPARVYLSCESGAFGGDEQWWHNFVYASDRARGQECTEDLFSPGEFVFRPAAKSRRARFEGVVQAALEPGLAITSVDTIEGDEVRRRTAFVSAATGGAPKRAAASSLIRLAWASDDFVFSRRGAGGAGFVSVLAGFPWFADWGRDSMICLPGLFLVTGRHQEALRVLKRFADARRNGIVPNRFGDDEGEPLYNTVDASLWFIVACWRYLRATGDKKGFQRELMPACLDVVEHYRRGTDQAIAMDPEDFLIAAGSPMTQLTWMDAQRDGVVFTPRHGKAVEINALWCSGLAMLAESGAASAGVRSADLRALADAASSSFRTRFWNESRSCCFDTITQIDGRWTGIADVRPNQVFAASLPFSPLTPTQRRDVVSCVREHLYTPMGLRTLEPGHPAYRARFRGDLYELDRAYHNGTVWPWLLGAFAEAVMRVGEFSKASRDDARRLLAPVVASMDRWCLGQIPEVFDAEETPEDPRRAGGCPAQAWSVAEVMRALAITESGEK